MQEGVQEAFAHFKKADPVLYAAGIACRARIEGRVKPKARNDQLFATLAGSIVSQQLSTKAADTIWLRLKEACGGKVTAQSIAKASPARLRRAGLSGSKVKALKALAAEVNAGLNLRALKDLPHEEASERLTRIWGIGPWTVEMFLIFALGAPDVFSPGDLGLVRAVEELYGLPKGTSRTEILAIAEKWAPHRSVACLVLWEHRDTRGAV